MHTVSRIDYKEASHRHFEDAEFLFREGRSANAGHLYGLHAECGLKAILVACGIPINMSGDISKPYREHIDKLSGLFLGLAVFPNGKNASWCSAFLGNASDFNDWEIAHRYWNTSAVPIPSVQKWKQAAQDICALLDAAKTQGLL